MDEERHTDDDERLEVAPALEQPAQRGEALGVDVAIHVQVAGGVGREAELGEEDDRQPLVVGLAPERERLLAVELEIDDPDRRDGRADPHESPRARLRHGATSSVSKKSTARTQAGL